MKRGHENSEELYSKVALVERNECPGGLALVNAKKVAKKGHNEIVNLAMEIEKADNFIYATACNKLQVIAQQVRFLKEQAKQVLQEAKDNKDLHHAACNFVKVAGQTYHLYKRPTGQQYFSMISPQEWNCPHHFMGSFRLELDQSWTPIEDVDKKDSELKLINKILNTQENMNIALEETPMDI